MSVSAPEDFEARLDGMIAELESWSIYDDAPYRPPFPMPDQDGSTVCPTCNEPGSLRLVEMVQVVHDVEGVAGGVVQVDARPDITDVVGTGDHVLCITCGATFEVPDEIEWT